MQDLCTPRGNIMPFGGFAESKSVDECLGSANPLLKAVTGGNISGNISGTY